MAVTQLPGINPTHGRHGNSAILATINDSKAEIVRVNLDKIDRLPDKFGVAFMVPMDPLDLLFHQNDHPVDPAMFDHEISDGKHGKVSL
jgi:hypothetical protein